MHEKGPKWSTVKDGKGNEKKYYAVITLKQLCDQHSYQSIKQNNTKHLSRAEQKQKKKTRQNS